MTKTNGEFGEDYNMDERKTTKKGLLLGLLCLIILLKTHY